MIKRVRVRNFLCLKDTTFDLGPFAMFVGPNASGKSAIFKALTALSKLLRAPIRGRDTEFQLGYGNTLDRLVWKADDKQPIEFDVWFDEGTGTEPNYTLELRKLGAGWSVSHEVLHLKDFHFDSNLTPFEHRTEFRGNIRWEPPYPATLSNLTFPYRRDTAAISAIKPFMELSRLVGNTWRYRTAAGRLSDVVYPPREFAPLKEAPSPIYVDESGWGLAWVLRRLQGEDKATFDRIEDTIRQWFPHIRAINFEEERYGVKLAFTSSRSARLIPADLESDGVLHSLLLLWRLYTKESETTICIEEPENGCHPYLLKARYEFLNRTAEEMSVRDSRVLVATHSPEFLSAVDPKEAMDIIRIVEYDSEVGTSVYSLRDMHEVEKLLEVFKGNLGELWWSGVIGGVPKSSGQ
jgi:predicted ATPase